MFVWDSAGFMRFSHWNLLNELAGCNYFANKTKGLGVPCPTNRAERAKSLTEHGKKRLENVDTPVRSGWFYVFFDHITFLNIFL